MVFRNIPMYLRLYRLLLLFRKIDSDKQSEASVFSPLITKKPSNDDGFFVINRDFHSS